MAVVSTVERHLIFEFDGINKGYSGSESVEHLLQIIGISQLLYIMAHNENLKIVFGAMTFGKPSMF